MIHEMCIEARADMEALASEHSSSIQCAVSAGDDVWLTKIMPCLAKITRTLRNWCPVL